MANNLYSFTGAATQDPTTQAGIDQYIQQGQAQINPGQAQVAGSNPVAAAGMADLAKAFAAAQQQGTPAQSDPSQMPMDVAQQALAQGAAQNPNMGDQNMGGVGPTMQNQALAQALMQQKQNPQQPMDFSQLPWRG